MSKPRSGSFTRRDGKASLLVVDPDPLMLTAIGSVLNMQGFRAVLAREESQAIESIVSGEFDGIILSIDDLDAGCQFTERLRNSPASADVPIIFLVPELSPTWRRQLSDHGGVFSMLKPIEPDDLIELVDKVLWMPHIARGRLGTGGHHFSTQADWVSLDNDGS